MCCERCTCPYSLGPDVCRRLAACCIPRNSHTHTHTHTHAHTHTSLAAVTVNVEKLLLYFPMGDVWYLHRLRTRGDVSLLPDVSTPPPFFLDDFTRTLLCCRPLLSNWLILTYVNLALLCLPGIFTRIWFLCPQCRLEFEPRSRVAIHYNPPSSSVGLHVLYPRESKCSKWWNRNFINN